MLVGLLLVGLMIKRPERLLPEVLGDGRATPATALEAARRGTSEHATITGTAAGRVLRSAAR